LVSAGIRAGFADLCHSRQVTTLHPPDPLGGRVGGLGSYAVLTQDQYHDPLPSDPPVVSVGVVDTGLVLRDGQPQQWLADRVRFDPVADADRIPPDDPEATRGHGTFVAGLILHQAPGAVVHMKGVLDRATGQAEDAAVALALYELAGQGIKVINLSFSGDGWEAGTPPALAHAIEALGEDAVVVAAAGNSGSQRPLYPAAMRSRPGGPRIVAVGALDSGPGGPRVAEFSNFGSWVSVYADGVDVLGPYGDERWARWSGTSFAAAVVTGAIAHVLASDPAVTSAPDAVSRIAAGTLGLHGVNGLLTRPYVRARTRSTGY
jgi:subtilisin family serine protease